MDTETRKQFLVAECQSMITLLTDRLGDNHPWSKIDLLSLDDEALATAKRLMHELLYAPPPRNSV